MATPDTQTADTAERIFIGKGEQLAWLTLGLANRHGVQPEPESRLRHRAWRARRAAAAMIFLQFSESDVC